MKWFVTDAQLDALRWEADQRARAYLAEERARLYERHELEVARLRNDRVAELERLADPHAPFLAHLTELVAILRRDVVHERQRAEIAIDQCRATHLAIGPVTLPPRPERMTEARDPSPFSDPELAAMGDRMAYKTPLALAPPEEQARRRAQQREAAHALDNLVPACRSCNAKKHAMTLLRFLWKRCA